MDIENINKKKWLSSDEAALYTGYKKQYLYKLVTHKNIRHYKPIAGRGGKLIFSREDLDEYIQRGCVEPKN